MNQPLLPRLVVTVSIAVSSGVLRWNMRIFEVREVNRRGARGSFSFREPHHQRKLERCYGVPRRLSILKILYNQHQNDKYRRERYPSSVVQKPCTGCRDAHNSSS